MRGTTVTDHPIMLPGEDEARRIAGTMREAVAALDRSADLLDRLAAIAAADVAVDLGRHAEAVRAIRRRVAGPPRDQWDVEEADSLGFQGTVEAAD